MHSSRRPAEPLTLAHRAPAGQHTVQQSAGRVRDLVGPQAGDTGSTVRQRQELLPLLPGLGEEASEGGEFANDRKTHKVRTWNQTRNLCLALKKPFH